MKENKFGVLFRHWVMANAPSLMNSTFELKQTATNSISFNCVEEHQVDYSMAIRWGNKGVLTRVESGSVGCPDYIYLKNVSTFIVIKYLKGFVIIDIDTFNLEKGKSKSLSWPRACEIAWKVV